MTNLNQVDATASFATYALSSGLSETLNNQTPMISKQGIKSRETDIPLDEPGIIPVAYRCNYCGDLFYVKGAFCSSRGEALNCFRYKKK